MNIYLKEYNKEPDMEEPIVMHKGDTLRTLCEKLHKDFVKNFKFARIWGKSAKFAGQQVVNLDHELKDGDVVEVRLT